MVRKRSVTVVGAGYTGLTTAAELSLRGWRVTVVGEDLGYRPPLTIVGTQVTCQLPPSPEIIPFASFIVKEMAWVCH